MRKKISKKQIGAVGMAAMMAVQTPAMAVETTQETSVQETTQETPVETSTEEVKTETEAEVEVEESEASTESEQATEVSTEEMQTAEEVVTEATEEVQEEAGIAVLEAEEDGWHENSDGSRYYVKNGEILKNCVEKIGEFYYGFDQNGVLYVDEVFYLVNELYEWYRAKEDGTLYANEWCEDRNYKYYYGEDAKAYMGLHVIDGKQYYFDTWRMLCQKQLVMDDGKEYYCDAEGIATELALMPDSWIEIRTWRCYVKDGKILKNCVEKIGDFYYGFDRYNGGMYSGNQTFEMFNEETQQYDHYRAKEDGSLYVNEWYEEENGKYYYGEEGKAYSDIRIVDGKQYYFGIWGFLCQKRLVTAKNEKEYYCDAEGIATALELMPDSWLEVYLGRCYVKDGKSLRNCVEKIGDFYYGFSYDGRIYDDNEDFRIFNEETKQYEYYRAKEDGKLYVNEWYDYYDKYDESENGRYYYGEGGKAYTGLQNINGKQYYFNDYGKLYQKTIITAEDGNEYYCDAEGVATRRDLVNNTWMEVDGNRYYIKDGGYLKNCVEKIGDFYYGFNNDGVLYVNHDFCILNEETGKNEYYRAKADGSLCTNEWHYGYLWVSEEHETCYYGEEGKAYTGFQIIDGKQYYFKEYGGRYENTDVIAENGKIYYCDADGIATEMTNNAWTEINGQYYYVKDGIVLRNCVEKIGEFYYGFNYAGIMYTDCVFSVMDVKDNNYYDYYRAKSDGKLYTDERDEDGYYYGKTGKAVAKLREEDGKCYFGVGQDYCRYVIVLTEDGKYYYCAGDGSVTEVANNSWAELDGRRYYVKDGRFLKNCVAKIDGVYYGFDDNGRIYKGSVFYIEDEETGEKDYYRAKIDGSLYEKTWYQNGYYQWIYYGEDAKASKGLCEIDGKFYYFWYKEDVYSESGYILRTYDFVFANDKWYYCDADGVATELVNNGWTNIQGTYHYVKDGIHLTNCVVEIDGLYYGFNEGGGRYSDTGFWEYCEETGKTEYYRAKEDGSLYVNEWYYDHECYYGEGGRAYSGLQMVDGKQYYFEEGGWLCKNKLIITEDGKCYYCNKDGIATEASNNDWVQSDGNYYYVKDGKILKGCVAKIGDSYYGFAENGVMYSDEMFYFWNDGKEDIYQAKTDGSLCVNEWYDDHYYGADAKTYTGLQTVDGKLYYFRERGGLYRHEIITAEDGRMYFCDSEGIATEITGGGWINSGENRYYVKDGELVTSRVVAIDGAYYGFNNDGIMYSDGEFSIWNSELGKSEYYRAKEDGSLYVNEWYEYHPTEPGPGRDSKYYYGEGGLRCSGLQTIDGNQYYFSEWGWLYTDETVIAEDGKHYYCDSDGIATELPENGWANIAGNRYYIKNGEIVKHSIIEIDGTYYGFDWDGSVYTNTEFEYGESPSSGSYYYRAKEDGTLYVNEWYEYHPTEPGPGKDSKYYYGEGGRRCSGLQTIEGNQYYFSEWGWLYTDETVIAEDGKHYYCDSDGIATELPENGWANIAGNRYYIKNGEIVKNNIIEIDGAYYGFDWDGNVYTNTEFEYGESPSSGSYYYRAKEDGTLYINEWYEYYLSETGTGRSDKYYYGEGGRRCSGLQTIDGNQYYFAEDGTLCRNTTVTAANGKCYYCDEDGIATELGDNGWIEMDGKRYYIKNGETLKDCVEKIDGIYYGFDSDGSLCLDREVCIWDEQAQKADYYRAKADGSLYVNEWYIYNEANKYYYGEDAKAATGLQIIDGNQYHFDQWGNLSMNTVITAEDGTVYICNEDGIAAKLTNNDWTQIDGKYYYVKDGRFLENCIEKIGNLYYGFSMDGTLNIDCNFGIVDSETQKVDYYHAKADGSICINEWYETHYYGAEGKTLTGLQIIDGKQYYFDEYGGLYIATSIVTEDGKCYYCDSNGIANEISGNGWKKIGNDYIYVKDGQILQNCVVKIDGSYYGFAISGIMYKNTTFSLWNDEGYNCYWASMSGALYTNKWGDDTSIGIYYYGADGKAYKNIQTIDGIQYGFDSYGRLVQSLFTFENGAYYYCDAQGRIEGMMHNNQWYQTKGGDWYYVKDNTIARSCTVQINGKWYKFDWLGKMETGELNMNADGSLRTNTWVYDGEYWYYSGEDGQYYRDGIYEIEGVKYHFSNGANMTVSDVVYDNGFYYEADASGRLTLISSNGWVLVGNDYYYTENSTIVKSDIRKINEVYYVFDASGKMGTDGEYICGSVTCRARADGSLYASQWYQDVNGKWYYYDENAASVENGKVEINGVTYLFDSTRAMKTNGVIWDGENYYLADENGIWVQTPGWVLKCGCWYYVKEDGSLYTGVLEDGNARYYLNPVMETNVELRAIGDSWYNIGADGHLSVVPDGFHHKIITNTFGSVTQIVDRLYYTLDGKTPEKGWKVIDGSWYYFDTLDLGSSMSRPVVGRTYKIDDKYYLFNADGTMVSNGWKLVDEIWYYAFASGELATGDVKINDTLYHFDEIGRMQEETEKKTGIVIEDGICKLYSEDGILLETGNGQGWSLLGGNYYYLENDSLLTDGSYRLPDGNWYGFDSQGRMLANVLYENESGDLYWYAESGAAQTGWILLAGNWYYGSTTDGTLYTGFHTINGVKYYFDIDGIMQTSTVVADGKLAAINDSGAVTEIQTMADGWSCYNGEWYYYRNRNPYTGWVGEYYVSNGQMIHNAVISSLWDDARYYVDADGVRQRNTWCDDGHYYAKADGKLARNEWLNIDGTLYYFDKNFEKTTETIAENGVFAKDGQYFAAETFAPGWVLIDDDYYYKEGEDFVSNQAKKINGDWYLFDVRGKMVTGFAMPEEVPHSWYSTNEYDGGYYYYGKDGRRQSYTGWQEIDGKWYYFDEYSRAATGWQTINGVKYYFETTTKLNGDMGKVDFIGSPDHFMYTGYRVIGGAFYYFDASGACQGIERDYIGWHLDDSGNWYYIKNGHAVTGTTVIDGVLYEFDGYGVWNIKS